jgi:hypothetical protein
MNEETAKHILERLDHIERKIGEVCQLVDPFGVTALTGQLALEECRANIRFAIKAFYFLGI